MGDSGSSPGLRGALRNLVQHVSEAFLLRAELLAMELGEERRRWTGLLLWMGVLGLFGLFTLIFTSMLVVVVFWEQHRVAAVGGLAGFYGLIALVAVLRIRRILSQSPLVLPKSLDVWKKDYACLFQSDSDTNATKPS